VVATESHRFALEERLAGRGIDLAEKLGTGLYFSLDADELLARFSINGSITPTRSADVVGSLIARARGETTARHVRVFGEMVALLCAYPASFFSSDAESVMHVADISLLHEPRAAAQN
jgi:hypothetical protein